MKIYKNLVFLLFIMGIVSIKAQTLNQFLNTAAEHSLELKMAYADFEISLLDIDKISVLEDPNIKFGYFVQPIETRLGAQRAKFSFNQKIPWFGTLKNEKSALKQKSEARFDILENKKMELFLDIRKSYFQLLENKGLIDLKSEYLELLKSDKILIENKYKLGKGSQIDILKIDLQIELTSAELDVLNLGLDNLKIQFNTKLHQPTDSPIQLLEVLDFDLSYSPSKTQLKKHPKFKEIENNIEFREAEIELMKARNKPKLSFGLDYMLIDEIPDATITGNGQDAIMPSVQLSFPLFSKKNESKVKTAVLHLDKEQYMKDHMLLEFESGIEQSHTKLKAVIIQLKNNLSILKQMNQILKLQYTQYQSNLVELEDILKTKKEIIGLKTSILTLTQQANILQAQLMYLQNSKRS